MNRQQQFATDYHRYHAGLRGLGVTSQQITSTTGAGIMAAGGIVAAIPGGQLPGAVIAAVGALTSLIGGLFKPDLTKVEATHIVDQIEAQTLKPMVAEWRALPPEKKTTSMQDVFIQVFNKAWAAVQQGCSNPALGSAGVACIADRVRGGRWPWPEYYLDPILNDPEVHPDPFPTVESVTDSVTSFFGGTPDGKVAGIPTPLLIGGALVALAFAFSD